MKRLFYILIGGLLLMVSCSKGGDDESFFDSIVTNPANNSDPNNNQDPNDSVNPQNPVNVINDPIQEGSPAYGKYEMDWQIDGLGSSKGILFAENRDGITNQFHAYIDPAVGLSQLIMDKSFSVKADSIMTFYGPRLNQPFNCMIRRKFVGFSKESYYYTIADFNCFFCAYVDNVTYAYDLLIDTDLSTMLYDSKKEQWSGVIFANKIQVDKSINNAIPLPDDVSYYNLENPLKLVFSTTKKIE